ncbi:MAG: MarC family protein [Desulfobaccales bacterium]
MEHSFLGPTGALLITSLISLFIIMDPPGNIFPYLALSEGYAPAIARGLAWRACLYAFLILALFIVVGRFSCSPGSWPDHGRPGGAILPRGPGRGLPFPASLA